MALVRRLCQTSMLRDRRFWRWVAAGVRHWRKVLYEYLRCSCKHSRCPGTCWQGVPLSVKIPRESTANMQLDLAAAPVPGSSRAHGRVAGASNPNGHRWRLPRTNNEWLPVLVPTSKYGTVGTRTSCRYLHSRTSRYSHVSEEGPAMEHWR